MKASVGPSMMHMGYTFKYIFTDKAGYERVLQGIFACFFIIKVSLSPQTGYLCLNTPSAHLGLGKGVNYLDFLFIGSSKLEVPQSYKGLIPNSILLLDSER